MRKLESDSEVIGYMILTYGVDGELYADWDGVIHRDIVDAREALLDCFEALGFGTARMAMVVL